MRVLFMGSPEYAAIILRKLADAEGIDVVGVYTNADKVRGRGNALVPTPVKEAALELGLPVLQPKTLRDAEVQAEMAGFGADAICVAAYGKILPQEVLDIPPLGCLNVHASLLPRWRGAAPIQRAILAGDEKQGVSIMKMEAGLDTGDYSAQAEMGPAGKSAAAVTAELASLGGDLLVDVLRRVEAGTVQWIAQDESLVTYANKIEKSELNIAPAEHAEMVLRKVAASDEAHPCKAVLGGRTVAVLSAVPTEDAVAEGVCQLVAGRLVLGCADGAVAVSEVKPDGKTAMVGKAFAAGLQGAKTGVSWSAVTA